MSTTERVYWLLAAGVAVSMLYLLLVPRGKEAHEPAVTSSTESNPYDQGVAAAQAGEPLWMNPYCAPSGSTRAHDRWFAGWSFGMQKQGDKA
ncbi:hypothetical protein [Massilia sp. TN1-12]|uniref:hypothetical protein n=1 Tax=Massilia paldalensis TaxID=3377675 RepID=UPI00384E7E1D